METNKIKAVLEASDPYEVPYWLIQIDSISLDEWLELRLNPAGILADENPKYAGLVPALNNLTEPEEESIVWQRILPLPGLRTIAPLLVCPEHRDFSCLVVLVEVYHQGEQVIWERMGINYASAASPEDIDSSLEWLPEIGPLVFDKAEYLACLEYFNLLRQSKFASRS